MFTSILAFAYAFLKAVPAVVELISTIGKHLKQLDAEHNEKTANERLQIKKDATTAILNAATNSATDELSIRKQSDSISPTTGQLAEDKTTTSGTSKDGAGVSKPL